MCDVGSERIQFIKNKLAFIYYIIVVPSCIYV